MEPMFGALPLESHEFLPRCMERRRGLAMRILSVCPSVTRANCDKTVERSVQIYIPYEGTFSLVF